MSRIFPGTGTTDFLSFSGNIPGFEPCTMAAWIKPDAASGDWNITGLYNGGAPATWMEIGISPAAGEEGKLRASKRNTAFAGNFAITGNVVNANEWNHCVGIFTADNDRSCILNGDLVNKGTNAGSQTDFTVSTTSIGLRTDSSPNASFDGRIAHVAYWSAALTDAEVVALSQGASPLSIRRDALVSYYPIVGVHSPEIDLVGGNHMTVNGTLTASDDSPSVELIKVPISILSIPTPVAPQVSGSRNFGGTVSDKLTSSGNPLGTGLEPATVFGWFNPDNHTTVSSMFGIFDSATSADNYANIQLRNDGVVRISKSTSGAASADTVNTVTDGVWNSFCGKWIADNSREIILNGDTVNKGTNALSKADATYDLLAIGVFNDATPSNPFTGKMAHIALWDVALSDDEVVALHEGANPLWIRRNSLVSYWPIIGVHNPEIDIISANDLTVNGGVTANSASPNVSNIIGYAPITTGGVVAAPTLALGLMIGL